MSRFTVAFMATFAAGLSCAQAQVSPSELVIRIDRLENALRQLTGSVEQLQYQNQQLEQQLRRMQEDSEFRFQELGSKGGARPPQPGRPAAQPAPPAAAAPSVPGRRSDVFDPTLNPGAPGAPQPLGSLPTAPGGIEPPRPERGPPVAEAEIGAPGGRMPGAPLDLSTLSARADVAPPTGALPPPPPRNPSATGAVPLPPSHSPKDEYDLGYGYILRKDYAQAEDTFRVFLKRYPSDRLAPDAHYWLGESMFQRQRYRDAAEAFLTVSTKFETTGKAPDALLRLGQSLAALGEKEAACASLGEVMRKYPRASQVVRQGVDREQKRVHC